MMTKYALRQQVFAVLLTFGLVGSPSVSALTLFTDRASFQAALAGAPTFTDDFDSGYPYAQRMSNAEMSAIKGVTRYESLSFFSTHFVVGSRVGDRQYCAGCNGAFRLHFDGPSFAVGGTLALGLQFANLPPADRPDFGYAAFVHFADGSSQRYVLPAQGAYTTPLLNFWGIVSLQPIRYMDFGVLDGSANSDGFFVVDRLTVAVVNEPSTALLALLGLPWVLRRRQNA